MINFVQQVTPEMQKAQEKELITWVRRVLKGRYGTYIHNILYDLKFLCEEADRQGEKLT